MADNGCPPQHYDCSKCPAYCCSYDRIVLEKSDIRKLARHFHLDAEAFTKKYTRVVEEERVLRHHSDDIYGSVCVFLDRKTRRCTVYHARPDVCHEYPDRPRCGYYDFLKWERRHQDDPDFIPMRRKPAP